MTERDSNDIRPKMGAAQRIVDPIIEHDPNEGEVKGYFNSLAIMNNIQSLNSLTSAIVFQMTHYKIF